MRVHTDYLFFNTNMGHQVLLPVTNGKLDRGPWEQVFYAEFEVGAAVAVGFARCALPLPSTPADAIGQGEQVQNAGAIYALSCTMSQPAEMRPLQIRGLRSTSRK